MSENENKNGLLKFIIPGIVVALFAYQAMRSQPQPEQSRNPQNSEQGESQTPEQKDSRTPEQRDSRTPEQGDSQTPEQGDSQSSGQQDNLVGTWEGQQSTDKGSYATRFDF
jgi:hypothetical protein